MSPTMQPTPPSQRMEILDVLRGFALLGIFIMNMPYFHQPFFAGWDGTALWFSWWDDAAASLGEVLFAGKFNGLFSLLFAVGFSKQIARLREQAPDQATRIYLKR